MIIPFVPPPHLFLFIRDESCSRVGKFASVKPLLSQTEGEPVWNVETHTNTNTKTQIWILNKTNNSSFKRDFLIPLSADERSSGGIRFSQLFEWSLLINCLRGSDWSDNPITRGLCSLFIRTSCTKKLWLNIIHFSVIQKQMLSKPLKRGSSRKSQKKVFRKIYLSVKFLVSPSFQLLPPHCVSYLHRAHLSPSLTSTSLPQTFLHFNLLGPMPPSGRRT